MKAKNCFTTSSLPPSTPPVPGTGRSTASLVSALGDSINTCDDEMFVVSMLHTMEARIANAILRFK